jgi:hypothetical protein
VEVTDVDGERTDEGRNAVHHGGPHRDPGFFARFLDEGNKVVAGGNR